MGKPEATKATSNKSAKKKDPEKDQYYNFLILGSTGVGKSTFINAFVNYATYDTWETAKKNQPMVLINTKFGFTDENLTVKEISVTGKTNLSNESETLGDSATQKTTTYTFPLLGTEKVIRLIDTPGMADTGGIEQDEKNCDDILLKISHYEELHAICVLLTTDVTRITGQFEYAIKQLFARLDKSAVNNIVFIFTRSRASAYTPGDTFPILQRLLNNIKDETPHIDIPLNRQNIFCMDNETFRYLIAKNEVNYTEEALIDFKKSWDVSRKAWLSLLHYAIGDENSPGLKPHLTKNTVSVNEARRVIMQLSQPLADISQLISDNVYALEQHMKNLNRENQSFEELKKNLFIPEVDIKKTYFDQPRTVCADLKCMKPYKVGSKTKYHFLKPCHRPCYLRNISPDIIGSPELIHCAAMNGTKRCQNCGCDYSKHMHIYYDTELYETEVVDSNVMNECTTKKAALEKAEALIKQIENLKREREEEQDFILKSLAKFAWFLKHNAITPYNDSYRTYVGYLIDRENSRGDDADPFTLKQLQSALQVYEEYRKILDNAEDDTAKTINAAAITNLLSELFNLKHCGAKIKSLYENQTRAYHAERDNFEYVHQNGLNLTIGQSKNKTNSNNSTPKTKQLNRKKNNPKQKQQQQQHQLTKNQKPPKKQQQQQQQKNPGNSGCNPQQNRNQWRNVQQFQQSPPPAWHPPYFNNYQQGPPRNFYFPVPGQPPFNFPPMGMQPNWPNQMPQGCFQTPQQQRNYFQPPNNGAGIYQQNYPMPQGNFSNPPQLNQQSNLQQQHNRIEPSGTNNSFANNQPGPSKKAASELPTGVYKPKPKPKQNVEAESSKPNNVQESNNSSSTETGNTQTLEKRVSLLNLTEPNNKPLTGVYNQERTKKPRHSNTLKKKQGSHNNSSNAQHQKANNCSNNNGRNDQYNGCKEPTKFSEYNLSACNAAKSTSPKNEAQGCGNKHREQRKNELQRQVLVEETRTLQTAGNNEEASMVDMNEEVKHLISELN